MSIVSIDSDNTRSEHDLLGNRDVPSQAYYGVHTLRAIENFPITGLPISSAMALASSGESVTRPGVVGTLCLANSSFAWYSKRSMCSLSGRR